ncbi:MAG: hypothetical protein V4578_14060 [Pseudomonadota bacterium]
MAIDKDAFAIHLRKHAAKISLRKCATYVRKAMEAGGAKTTGHPVNAKDYGPVLLRNGYHELSLESLETYTPSKGDIAVIQPTSIGSKAGHIEGYDGKSWVSDFVQTGFWPGPAYRKEKPSYVIYRP